MLCLLEVILENVKYNLGREYKFYTTIYLGERSKGGTAVAIKNKIAHKRLNIRTVLHAVALEVNMTRKGKRTICLIYLPPNRPSYRRRYERFPGAVPSTYDTAVRLPMHTTHCGEVKK